MRHHTLKIFRYGFAARETAVGTSSVELRYPDNANWSDAMCRIVGLAPKQFDCSTLDEIGADGEQFPIAIESTFGQRLGPFHVQGLLCGCVEGAHCFLFNQLDNGLWAGVTIANLYGQLVAQPYQFDPS